MTPHLARLGGLLVALAATAPLDAQSPVLHAWDGETANAFFGYSVHAAGDVNGDGFADVIAGGWGNTVNKVKVYSGLGGSVLHTFVSFNDWFGRSVGGGGDVNGDGYDDIVVGAPADATNGPNAGMVRVFSGIDGSILHVFYGAAGNSLGEAVAVAGDVNADGFDDLIVGAPNTSYLGPGNGSAHVFSGLDGSTLHTFNGSGFADLYGQSVSGAGDVDGDGFDDLIVGAPRDDHSAYDAGRAWVYSGKLGTTLFSVSGQSASSDLGWSVSQAGDVDRDGIGDWIVGAPRETSPAGDLEAGSARVVSGATGAFLHVFYGNAAGDAFGVSVAAAGDLDGDGFADLVVGASKDDHTGHADSGSAQVFSGRDGTVLRTVVGDDVQDYLGQSVSGAGDVNGDGIDDLVIGAYGSDLGGAQSGTVRVYSGGSVPPGQSYCASQPNSTGFAAMIGAFGSGSVAAADTTLTAGPLPTGEFGLFFYGPGETQQPFGNGFLCVTGGIFRLGAPTAADRSGSLSLALDLTTGSPSAGAGAILPGSTWKFQCWYRDPAAGTGAFNLSDALSLDFQP